MKIVLHIMLKDLRRHWREITLFVLVCAAWAWQTTHPMSWQWLRQREIVGILLFGLWFFIAIRVVHGECLVGDREFWQTRPYRWGQLMGAKALLLVLCLNLPLLVAEIALLRSAGIPMSWHLVPGLLFLQLEFAFFLTFPAVAIASVTESLVQWILTIVGLILYGMAVSWLPWDKLPPTLEGGEAVATLLDGAIIVPLLAFALLWQYARRRVWPARLAVACAALAVPLTILIAPSPLVRSIAYPRPVGEAQLHLSAVGSATDGQHEYTRRDNGLGLTAVISIPITAGTVEPDTILDIDGTRVTLTGDKGWRWQSKWMSQSLKLSKDSPRGNIALSLPVEVADQLAQRHVTVQAEVAFGVYRLGPEQRIETTADRFAIPGVGFCRLNNGRLGNFSINGLSINGLSCVAPLRLPGVTVTRIHSEENTCETNGEPPLPGGHYATGVNYGTDGVPADFDPNPVRNLNLFMSTWIPAIQSVRNPKDNRTAYICGGTPLFVRTGTMTVRMRATFELGSLGTEKRVAETTDGTESFGR